MFHTNNVFLYKNNFLNHKIYMILISYKLTVISLGEDFSKIVSRIEGIAIFVFTLGLLSILVPWFASTSGLDVNVYVTPMFLIIGILNIISGIALFTIKK